MDWFTAGSSGGGAFPRRARVLPPLYHRFALFPAAMPGPLQIRRLAAHGETGAPCRRGKALTVSAKDARGRLFPSLWGGICGRVAPAGFALGMGRPRAFRQRFPHFHDFFHIFFAVSHRM